jgi:hypothetical protein
MVTRRTKVSPLPTKYLLREQRRIVTIEVYSGATFHGDRWAYNPLKHSLYCVCFSCVEAAEFHDEDGAGLYAYKPPPKVRWQESG